MWYKCPIIIGEQWTVCICWEFEGNEPLVIRDSEITATRKLFSKTSAENQAWPSSSSSLSGKLFSWSHAWPCNQDGLIKLFAGNCPTKTNPIYQTNTEIIRKMFKFKQLWNNSSFNFPRWRIFIQKFNIKSTLFWSQFVIDSFGTVQTHIINTITVAGEVDPRLILLS